MKQKIYKRKRIIPVGWKEIKLGDVFRTSSGATPLSTEKSYYEGGVIPWINSGELASPYIYKTSNYITQKGFENSSTEIYPKDTVLVAMYGATAGKASLLKIEACTNQAICAILPRKDYSPEFLKYNIDTLYEHLVGLSSGSARDNLSQAGLKKLKLVLPKTREEQENLVSVLTLLDKKIALNRQINDNLEAMAKQLYDYWFVQFDFPNEEGKPYKSSGGAMVWNEKLKREIPQGWSGVSLKDLALTSRNAITPVENEVYQHFSIPSFDACGSYSLDNGSDIKSDKFVLQKGQLLVSKLNPWFNRVVWVPKGTNMIGSTEFVVINPNNESESGYIYSVIKSPKFIAYCSQAATGTSHSQRRVSPDVLMAFKVVYEQGVVQKYGCLIEKIQKQQAELLSEIAMLTKQRDELLPLLMNGQASVNYHLSDD